MSDPKVFIDYEFHFANGQMIVVTLQKDRDVDTVDDLGIELTVHHSETCVEKMRILHDKLIAIRETTRIVQPDDSQT